MINLIDFTGKNIIVTGASSGIGKSISVSLSKLGANVVLIARREEELKSVKNLLEDGNHMIIPYDLKNLDGIKDMVDDVVSTVGKLDGMFYAAGIGNAHPVKLLSNDILKELFEVNYYPFIELIRCISRKGKYNSGARIVGVSSIAAKCGDAGLTGYSSTKAAMEAAIRSMSRELSSKGIVINSLAPAMTNTIMYTDYVERYGENSNSEKRLLERQYLGIADVQDIVNCGLFLLSDISKYIAGVTFYADGGYTSVQ
ncbi:MAG: SDR family oxidoreductase [Lachnospiraceae bacterium]|nr:SDR family oxidoreductase [Lachnospiraceae bacterium]